MFQRFYVLFTCVLGNALEFYNFVLYGAFSVIIGQLYFPSFDSSVSLFATLGTFASGFLMRPFGAAILGSIGDKIGRKKALSLSILLMGVPSIIIGLLPTYSAIGIFAPVLMIACRLVQGFSAGGEYNGAAIFALEHMGKIFPGLTGGFISASCVLGAFLAVLLAKFLTSIDASSTILWRLPFLLGGFLSFVGLYMRKNLSESPVFKKEKERKASELSKNREVHLFKIFKSRPKVVLATACVGALDGILCYTLFGFLSIYLSIYLKMPLELALEASSYGLLACMFASPFMGYIFDKLGASCFLSLSALFIGGAVYPIFMLMQYKVFYLIIIAQVLFGVATASISGSLHAYLQMLFPVQERYAGISFSFNLGSAVFGGTAPLILSYLVAKTDNLYMPAVYIFVWIFIFYLSVITVEKMRKTKNIL